MLARAIPRMFAKRATELHHALPSVSAEEKQYYAASIVPNRIVNAK
jgi:hypothetical protein